MSKKYWKGIEELNQTPGFVESRDQEFSQDISVDEFLADEKLSESSTPRRDFLKFLGFSVAAATIAACEAPVTRAIPYVNKPVDVTPGVATWYASTYYDGNSYANILVKTREGRPIYIKGNKDFGFTNGNATPQIIASVLSLYNEARLQYAFKDGQGVSTADADSEIIAELKKIKSKGGKVVLVSNTLASPSTYKAVGELEKSITGSISPRESSVKTEDKNGIITNVVDKAEDVLNIESETIAAMGTTNPTGAQFEHIQYDSVSYSAIRKANELSFGKSVIPDYNFLEAKTIVSFGADFLSTWLMSTQYTGQYSTRRNPDGKWMNKHYQIESNMSITGSNADVRLMIKPSEEAGILAALVKNLGGSINGVSSSIPENIGADVLDKIAKDLMKGNGLVVSSSNNIAIQVLVNKINHIIGAYTSTINLNNPVHMFASEDDKIMKLISDVVAGKGPDAVLFYGVNPVYSAPNGVALADALGNTTLTVSLSGIMDETASKCKYVVPDHHALESWNDFSPKANEYALAQPTIRPLYDTVSAPESLLVWSGKVERKDGKDSKVYFNYIKDNWSEHGFEGDSNFDTFWNTTIHNSVFSNEMVSPSSPSFNDGALSESAKQLPKGGELEVILYQKAAIGRGDQAANPWLQETPDPITKVTWDNYITMNPVIMEDKGYNIIIDQEHGCTLASITVGDITYELPVYPSPGQAPGTVGLALGYGRGEGGANIGKAAFQTKEYGGQVTDENGNPKPVGKNAFRMVQSDGKTMEYTAVATIENKDVNYPIATTQIHRTVMARNSIVRETTLDIYENHSRDAYNPAWTLQKIDENGKHVERPIAEFDLWDAHPVENVGHRWGMTIDLNSCLGCGSCLVACQAENNVPVVGKDEVRRGREMHWIRIDRYYASNEEAAVGTRKDKETFSFSKAERAATNPKVIHQPMMCHHCNHAPCETVCPVSATTHSNEGLNQMTYNRCIGTRYCANNCPYKVRRFNWFNYPSYKKFGEVNPAQDELGRMVLNPDVTVRTRGVMEKCSFCVQRIQEGKLNAKKDSRPVADGDITTACGDACPSNAITVGDWNDVNSKVRKSADHKRSYQVLEEIGLKPNMWYKVKVRNEENDILAGIQMAKEHEGGHHAESEEAGH